MKRNWREIERNEIFSLFVKKARSKLRKNFQPLRAKRAGQQTTGNNSNNLKKILPQNCECTSKAPPQANAEIKLQTDETSHVSRGSRGRAAPLLIFSSLFSQNLLSPQLSTNSRGENLQILLTLSSVQSIIYDNTVNAVYLFYK